MKGTQFILLSILLATVFLRLPYLGIEILNSDEASHALVAKIILKGGVPYRDGVLLYPPLISFLYAFIFKVFGERMFFIHIFSVIWVMCTVVLIYKLARTLYGKKGGYFAALFYAIFSTTYHKSDMMAFNCEMVMVLPLIAGIYFFIRAERENELFLYIIAGILNGMGFLAKQSAIVNLLALFFYEFLTPFLKSKESSFIQIFKKCFLMLAGFFIPLAGFFIYLWVNNIISDFIFWAIRYTAVNYLPAVSMVRFICFMIGKTLTKMQLNFLLWGLSFAGIASIVIRFIDRQRGKEALNKENSQTNEGILLFIWTIFSFLGICTGRRFFGHYFIQLIPSLAILAGFTMAQISIKIFRRNNWKEPLSLTVIIFIFLGLLIPISAYHGPCLVGKSYVKIFGAFGQPFFYEDLSGLNDKRVASYIKERTRPDERIFIWGFFPQTYLFAGRLPSTRFLVYSPLSGDMVGASVSSEAAKEVIFLARRMFLEDVVSHPPTYIIDYVGESGEYSISGFKELSLFLKNNYILETKIDNVSIHRHK